MGILDQLVAAKVKKSQEDSDKAQKQQEAATINKSIYEMAQQTGDKEMFENVSMMLEAIGNNNPDASKLVYKSIEDRIKEQAKTSRSSQIIETAKSPGGAEKLMAENPLGIKASDGGATVEVPSSIEQNIKTAQEKEKKSAQAEATAKGTYRFLQQFGRSYNELKSFDPKIDEVGVGGWLTRNAAKIGERVDAFPETSALKIQILPMANSMAREIEGGKVTDSDRQIYADSFASAVNFPTKTNVRLMSQSLVNLIDKGGDQNGAITNQLKQLATTKTDIFNSVLEQVVIEFPDMAKKIFGEDYEVVE